MADETEKPEGEAPATGEAAPKKGRKKALVLGGGSVAVGSTREAFARHLAVELDKWAKVIKASGARVD